MSPGDIRSHNTTGQAMKCTHKRNIEARSCNHFSCAK